jgi:hypothetical protein
MPIGGERLLAHGERSAQPQGETRGLPEASAQIEPRSIVQHHFRMPLEHRVHFADTVHVHNDAAVNAQEVIRVQRFAQMA